MNVVVEVTLLPMLLPDSPHLPPTGTYGGQAAMASHLPAPDPANGQLQSNTPHATPDPHGFICGSWVPTGKHLASAEPPAARRDCNVNAAQAYCTPNAHRAKCKHTCVIRDATPLVPLEVQLVDVPLNTLARFWFAVEKVVQRIATVVVDGAQAMVLA